MPRNWLPWVMKHYSPTGRRNHGRPLKRLLDTWDRNGSTSGPTPWQIYDDDDDILYCWLVNSYQSLGVARSCYQQGPAVQQYTAGPWRWRQHTLPQCRYLFTSQHITQHLRRIGSPNQLSVGTGNRTGNNKCSATFTVH
jgi:hypothetical protein